MRIPLPLQYAPSKVTWPASAMPDYGGKVGFIIHDGSFPYFTTSSEKYVDLPDDLCEIVDPMLQAAMDDNRSPCREQGRRYKNGIAIYGHLVGEYFFSRYLLDLDVALGKVSTRADLGMAGAMLMRVMGDVGALHTEYRGGFWRAVSEPVINDLDFGRRCAQWNGKPQLYCRLRFQPMPRVPIYGALLTDMLAAYNPSAPLSWKPTAQQLEDLML